MSTYNYPNQPLNKNVEVLWENISSASLPLQSIAREGTTIYLTFANDLLDSDLSIVQSLVDNCPLIPSTNRKLTKLAFRSRFTFAERMALDTSTAPEIIVLRNDLSVAEYVDLDYPDIDFGLSLLVAKSIITPERKAEILA
jgi:hypothetical protein